MKKFPFTARTLNSNLKIQITNHIMAYNISWYEYIGYIYSIEINVVEVLKFKNELIKPLKFYGAIYDGDIQGVFGQDIYGDVECKGVTVLDIGANIGDSAIYFAMKAASRVIALEPFPVTYEFAKRNIEVNGFLDKIVLINGGVAKQDGSISIPNNITSSGGMEARESECGPKIQFFTLESISKAFNLEIGSILKIDCEGCEYDIINCTQDKILLQFKQIIMEYHHGIKELVARLSSIGFQVQVNHRGSLIGDIIAKNMKLLS